MIRHTLSIENELQLVQFTAQKYYMGLSKSGGVGASHTLSQSQCFPLPSNTVGSWKGRSLGCHQPDLPQLGPCPCLGSNASTADEGAFFWWLSLLAREQHCWGTGGNGSTWLWDRANGPCVCWLGCRVPQQEPTCLVTCSTVTHALVSARCSLPEEAQDRALFQDGAALLHSAKFKC